MRQKQQQCEQQQEVKICLAADAASWRLGGLLHGLLNDPAAGLRLQLDFAERRFILGHVLLQHIEKRFGLLRTDVNSLKIMNRHVVWQQSD